jgi:hypothetical protein
MGVLTFILERRTATLEVGHTKHSVGTLRTFVKVTELSDTLSAELDAAALIRPSPVAAMVVAMSDLALASDPDQKISAHRVIGWDDGRGSVTDLGWDYLPQLGFAILDGATGAFVLHREADGLLHPFTVREALGLGILDGQGRLIRRGQPRITECRSVLPYIDGYAMAGCSFDNGRGDELIVATPRGCMPPPEWFVGKRPMDVGSYDAAVIGD